MADFNVKFQSSPEFAPSFREVQRVSDGGYERGHAEGIKEGYVAGHEEGVKEGYAAGQYTDVSWIESNGEQWIKTDIVLTENSRFELCIEPVATPQAPSAFFGARDGNASLNSIGMGFGSNMSVSVDFANSNYAKYRAITTATLNKKYICVADKYERRICDEYGKTIVENTAFCEDTITTRPVSVFIQTGVPENWVPSAAKVHYLKIWENGELVADLVPYASILNGGGLRNKINGKTYPNAGEGSFSYGLN